MKRVFAGVCVLAAAALLSGCAQPVALFNGQNLNGWVICLEDDSVDAGAVWSVHNEVLRCAGRPKGYIRTANSYSNYILQLEWRWPETPGNSGVLLHTVGEDRIWPQCIEAQLKHLSAGDFVAMQPGTSITVDGVVHTAQDAPYKVVPKRLPTSEKFGGQWNRYRIVCRDNTIELYVNGVLQNSAASVRPYEGAICLQSEGAPIEFRNITLLPLRP